MFSAQISRPFLSFTLLLLTLLSAGVPSPVRAEEGEITPSATPTLENSASATETPTATLTSTFTPTPAPESTLTATFTPAPTEATQVLEIPTLRGDYVGDEVLVRFGHLTESSQSAASACFGEYQVEITRELGAVGASLLRVPTGKVAEIIAQAENCPQILFAEPNYQLYALDTFPDDPHWNLQYGLTNIHAPQAWDMSVGSAAVVIAVVDTGVDLTHPDLAPKLVAGYDFVNGDDVPQDDNGHGTHVAGIAAAQGNNGEGVVGVSWGARVMPVKVLSASANGSFADAAAGIIWAADHGAQIINLSLGGSSYSQVFKDAVDYAYGKGVMLVASSGNNGGGAILYPARFANVMAVGATDSNNVRASFSNYGAELDVVAPGVNIYSTGPGTYYYNSGTSMSAPFVSGLAAILRGLPGSGSPANLAWAIKSTALDLGVVGRDSYYGDGLIQMDAAIQLFWMPSTATPTITPTATPTYTANPNTGAANQTDFGFASVALTASPTPTDTATASTTPIVFVTPSPLAISTVATEAWELFALATPTRIPLGVEEKTVLKNYFPFCLGSSLIGLGGLLFLLGNRIRRVNQV